MRLKICLALPQTEKVEILRELHRDFRCKGQPGLSFPLFVAIESYQYRKSTSADINVLPAIRAYRNKDKSDGR